MRIIESVECVVVSGGRQVSIGNGGATPRSIGEIVCSLVGETAGKLSSRIGCTSQACQQLVSQAVGAVCENPQEAGKVLTSQSPPEQTSSSIQPYVYTPMEPVMADEFSGQGYFEAGGGDFSGAGASGGWDGFDSYDA
jgi:hypothetical protein